MLIPAHFYYHSDSEERHYTTQATGVMDINRLMQNQSDFWIRTDTDSSNKPKTLIINDWTLETKNRSEKLAYINLLKTLMSPPHLFTVYLQQSGEVLPLKKESLDTLSDHEVTGKIIPCSDSELVKKMGAHELSHEKVLVLNHHEMRQLDQQTVLPYEIDVTTIQGSSFSLSEIRRSVSDKSDVTVKLTKLDEEILNFVREEQYSLAQIGKITSDIDDLNICGEDQARKMPTHTVFAEKLIKIPLELYSKVAKMLVEKKMDEVNLFYLELLLKRPGIRRVGLSDIHLTQHAIELSPASLPDITQLNLDDSTFSTENITRILNALSGVRNIIIQKIDLEGDDIALEETSLSALQSLYVYTHDEKSRRLLLNIMQHASQLKHLYFVTHSLNYTSEELSHCRLQQLKSLAIQHGANISSSTLSNMLKKTSHLENLIIEEGTVSEGDWHLEEDSLNRLQSLTLTNMTMGGEQFSSLLNHGEGLKTVTIHGCDLRTDIVPLKENQINKIDLINTPFSSSQLSVLFNASKHLESLKLSRIKERGALTLDEDALQSLKTLEIAWSELSSENICLLLNHAKHLKTFTLTSYEKTMNLATLNAHALSQLETLALKSAQLDSDNLSTLLKQSKNLKHLKMTDCTYFNTALILEGVSLLSLETLEIDLCDFHDEFLSALLQKAPNLRQLKLTNINSDFSLELGECTLNELKEITIISSKTTSKTLTTLLSKATHLESFILRHDKGESIDLSLTKSALPKLKDIQLSSVNLTGDGLSSLLTAATNAEVLFLTDLPIADKFLKEKAYLPRLKQLSIENFGDCITDDELSILLDSAPNLEKLDMKKVGKMKAAMLCDEHALSKLTHFSYTLEPGCEAFISSFLNQASHLTHLNLDGSVSLDVFALLDPFELKQLRSLSLESTHMGSGELVCFLNETVQLKTLNFANSSCVLETPILVEGVLAALEELNLSANEMMTVFLSTFLHGCKGLKRLDISACTMHREDFFNLPKTPLLSLLYINAENCDLSHENLLNLILHCPNLQNIKLDRRQKLALEKLNILEYAPQLKSCLTLTDEESRRAKSDERRDVDADEDDVSHKVAPASIAAERTLVDPTHNVFKHFDTSEKDHSPFLYTGKNKTLNQGMIIEKFSQFLTLTTANQDIIPRIQDGICYALSHLFNTLELKAWDAWLKLIHEWPGELESITSDLTDAFEELQTFIVEYQFEQKETLTYLGEETLNIIKTSKKTLCLQNPWHTISIKYDKESRQYILYDPNYIAGYKRIDESDIHAHLQKSLGPIVDVVGKFDIDPQKTITDFPAFMAEGGLLVLSGDKGKPLHPLIDLSIDYPLSALDGLFIRSNDGEPAWLLGLENEDALPIFKHLLHMLQKKKPDTFLQNIKKSISHLPDSVQSLAYRLLLSTFSVESAKDETSDTHPTSTMARLGVSDLKYQLLYEQYLTHFKSSKTMESPPSVSGWLNDLIHTNTQKQLIRFDDRDTLDACLLSIDKCCHDEDQPVFFVNSPSDLICDAPWIEKKGTRGIKHPGPGGPFYDFLTDSYPKGTTPLIVIDYTTFKDADMIKFNTILDDIRKSGRVDIPPAFQIIGLSDGSDPNAYEEADFLSRFNKRSDCPFDKTAFKEIMSGLTPSSPTEGAPYVIDLYHGQNWQTCLEGHWLIHGHELSFQEGELIKALRSGKPIQINNPPKDQHKFSAFISHLIVKERHQGYKVPDISIGEGYDFKSFIQKHVFIDSVAGDFYAESLPYLLNPNTLSSLFSTYECDNKTESIYSRAGKLKAHFELHKSNESIPPFPVYLTRSLSRDDWARLLRESNKIPVELVIQIAPGIDIPQDLIDHVEIIPKSDVQEALPIPTPSIYISNDIDASCKLLLRQKKHKYLVIDATEYEPQDLLSHITSTTETDSLDFKFHAEDKAVLKALEAGQHVILKGPFNPYLADALPDYVRRYPSLLTLITDNQQQWTAIPNQTQSIGLLEKKQLLSERLQASTIPDAFIDSHSYAAVDALLTYQETHASDSGNIDAPWQALYDLPMHFDLGEFDPAAVQNDIKSFKQNRLSLIEEALKHSPIACIAGLTGVGKSTFIGDTLSKHKKVFIGEDKIKAWAEDPSGGVLFIDEANITSREWSEFEGLFNKPPIILIEGKVYPLDNTHKVLFAFNPTSYGGDRKVNRLFERHPNAVVFDPIPLNVIYGLILAPLFHQTKLEDKSRSLSEQVLSLYRFLCERSDETLLISIRELKSIVMLTIAAHEANPDTNPNDLLLHMINKIAGPLVPEHERESFNHLFPQVDIKKDGPSHATIPTDFVSNETTRQISDTLDAFLDLRSYRQHNESLLHDSQLHGGLGGFIVEGEPGLGKSHLVKDRLIQYGLTEGELNLEKPQVNVFYHIPVNTPLDLKKALILKAFDEGNPVILDEINSTTMMERFLNNLLMGKGPDNQWAKKPGFFIIGTQNPLNMAGRQAASQALSRRMIKTVFPLYSPLEMTGILIKKGIAQVQAKAMVDAFMIRRKEAIDFDHKPIPCFRDLTNLVDAHTLAQQAKTKTLAHLLKDMPAYMNDALISLPKSIQSDLYLLYEVNALTVQSLLHSLYENDKLTFDIDSLKQALTLFKANGDEALTFWQHIMTVDKILFLSVFEQLSTDCWETITQLSLEQSSLFKQICAFEEHSSAQISKIQMFCDIVTAFQADQDIKRATQLYNINSYLGKFEDTDAEKSKLSGLHQPSTGGFFADDERGHEKALYHKVHVLYDSIKHGDTPSLEGLPEALLKSLEPPAQPLHPADPF